MSFIKINCRDCRLCCQFHSHLRKKINALKAQKVFSWPENMADIFFNKEDDYYNITRFCRWLKNEKCSIHADKNRFPSVCALYPFLIVKNKRNIPMLLLEKSCPNWKTVYYQWKNSKLDELLTSMIRHYHRNKKLFFLPQEDLRKYEYQYKILKPLAELDLV